MGINGLLPLLKSIHKSVNLRKFEGKTIGVDAYGWLHRGAVACAMELAMGKPTRKFVDFAMHRVRMLQHFGVTPYLIFDGDYLPMKAATEASREKRRADSKRLGMELLNAGKSSQAYLEFQKAVDVTPEMARQLIDELNKTGVQYVVAPYEADAQMVYLERKGIIHAILSEDSDLLVFGAKCLLTKLDQYGNCIEINKADFCACKDVSLTGWSDAEFRQMAILSGCDYLASISNMGLKTAYRMVRKHKTIEKVIRMLQFDGKFNVPKGYLESFYQAEFTFLHQRVFCPISRRMVFHTEPRQQLDEANMAYIGEYVEPTIAEGVARGDLDPMTKKPLTSGPRKLTASPKTPWAPSTSKARNRGSALSGDPHDLKKGGSIETFFRKRTPLAELPINIFRPSPNQQELYRRHAGVDWQASPAQTYSTTQSVSQPLPPPSSAPAPARSVSRVLRSPTISEPRPKRARLCEDDSPGLPVSRSRFFSSSAADPSPTVGKFSRRRGKKEEITIYSDDSVEEALLSSLSDIEDGFADQHSGKKLAIFKDLDDNRPATPVPSVDLKSKFSFGPPTPGTAPRPHQSRIPVAVKPRQTPLQRLGASARNRLPMTPPLTPVYTAKTASTRRSLLSSQSLPFPEVSEDPEPKKTVECVEPASVPLPVPDGTETVALKEQNGSEDLIIHDSEEEEMLSPHPARINLGQFAYVGN